MSIHRTWLGFIHTLCRRGCYSGIFRICCFSRWEIRRQLRKYWRRGKRIDVAAYLRIFLLLARKDQLDRCMCKLSGPGRRGHTEKAKAGHWLTIDCLRRFGYSARRFMSSMSWHFARGSCWKWRHSSENSSRFLSQLHTTDIVWDISSNRSIH